ncbi:patatin-like phospholipase family protein [Kyrpidia tusciae]|uniref:Patatin n=1 Tax=Kyrpidia tusciae (strain DSM 2912 / NBRC 15312 / T2) TaxID=562970 RepID=D5WVU9_KYRT2|nr:patatin-like phospholipase family protein [Kyrpidia tusciae]ADG07642.1 Patatin [Kyrpidia tusciae DSM 2912]
MKAVGLALSGGAAASAAHVGVIRAFEEAGYVITHMSGTSGGALVAGLWAAGYGGRELRHLLDRLERRHFDVDWKSLARRRLLRHRGEWLGFFRASRLERWLASLTDFRQVRDLLRPVALPAVDLTRGREVIFASRPLGDVRPPNGSSEDVPGHGTDETAFEPTTERQTKEADGAESTLRGPGGLHWEVIQDIPASLALLASSAVPVIFQPMVWKDRVFVDGGLLDNCPVAPLRALGAPAAVAVDLVSPWGWRPQRRFDGPISILFRSVNVMLAHQSRTAHLAADWVIHPEIPPIAVNDFRRLGEVADAAYEWTCRTLEKRREG